MKILILGSNGNLGQQLVTVFDKNNEVIAWDRGEIDITDKELIFKKIKDVKPDIMINSAAYNAVDKCEVDEKEFELAEKLNGGAVGYLAEAAIEVGAILVHYSTDYVFSGDKKEGYNEYDEPCPVNKYGETKLMGEQEIIKRSGQGLKWYLIRTSKLFGPKNVETICKSFNAKPSFFDMMLKLAKEKNEIDVVDEEMSCFTYTIDLAKATKKLIEQNYGYGIYHIINNGHCTWYKAATELFKIVETHCNASLRNASIQINPVSSNKFPRPAKRPKYSVLLNTKFEQLRDWKEALKEYLK